MTTEEGLQGDIELLAQGLIDLKNSLDEIRKVQADHTRRLDELEKRIQG